MLRFPLTEECIRIRNKALANLAAVRRRNASLPRHDVRKLRGWGIWPVTGFVRDRDSVRIRAREHDEPLEWRYTWKLLWRFEHYQWKTEGEEWSIPSWASLLIHIQEWIYLRNFATQSYTILGITATREMIEDWSWRNRYKSFFHNESPRWIKTMPWGSWARAAWVKLFVRKWQ